MSNSAVLQHISRVADLSAALKEATQSAHRDVEPARTMTRAMGEGLTYFTSQGIAAERAKVLLERTYIQFLVATYQFEAACEATIDTPGTSQEILRGFGMNRETPRSSVLILQDLTALVGLVRARDLLAGSGSIEWRFEGAAELAGLDYVRRGSRMGGVMLAKIVADDLGLPVGKRSFLSRYGSQTAQTFRDYLARLNQFGRDIDQGEWQRCLDAANRAFDRVGKIHADVERRTSIHNDSLWQLQRDPFDSGRAPLGRFTGVIRKATNWLLHPPER